MSMCPSCGAENPLDAERCATCGRPLTPAASEPRFAPLVASPPPSAPAPLPPPPEIIPPPAPPVPPVPPGSAMPGRPMLTPMTPLPPVATPDPRRNTRRYFYGLAAGAIPLVLALVSVAVSVSRNQNSTLNASAGFGLIASAILYVAALITMIVFLVIPRLRPVGYGLLTAVAASPVIFAVGCTALIASGGL